MVTRYAPRRTGPVAAARWTGDIAALNAALELELRLDWERFKCDCVLVPVGPEAYHYCLPGRWVVRHPDGRLEVMSNTDFGEAYQPLGADGSDAATAAATGAAVEEDLASVALRP